MTTSTGSVCSVLFKVFVICYDYIASVVDECIVKNRSIRRKSCSVPVKPKQPHKDRPGFELCLPM